MNLNKMKASLILQTLSPLAILIPIRNFPKTFDVDEFIRCDIDYVIYLVSLIFLILSVSSYFCFRDRANHLDGKAYTVRSCERDYSASVNFFVACLLPLLIDDVNSFGGFVLMISLLLFLFLLLIRTNLYYTNPIISILGYKIYKVQIQRNERVERLVVISLDQIEEGNTILYEKISDNVSYGTVNPKVN